MSMRTYGVETKGMIITLNNFQVLLSLNRDNINYDFTDIDNVDFDEIIDFVGTINYATFVGEFNGYLDTDKTQERVYFGGRFDSGEDIILIELMKDSLYEKYNDREEIIRELKNDLSQVGINVDDTYIEEHFGYINGSYYA